VIWPVGIVEIDLQQARDGNAGLGRSVGQSLNCGDSVTVRHQLGASGYSENIGAR